MKTKLKKPLTLLFILCFSLLFSSSTSAASLPDSYATSLSLQETLDTYIETYKDTCPSLSIEVFQNEETLYHKQYGFSDIENQIAVNSDTVYEWASVTKLLVWTSVLQLYEQNLIDLNEDIRVYLPPHFFKKLAYDEPITMIDLMNHQGGWQETIYDITTSNPENMISLEAALMKSEPEQVYAPGTVTAYSNWGSALAGYIVERITGTSFTNYVHENIFEPLGMNHTSIAPDSSDNPSVLEQRKLLKGYLYENDTLKTIGSGLYYILLYLAGAAKGTLEDFATFAKAFVPNSPTSCKLFKTPLICSIDSLEFKRTITNLITNAYKHNLDGSKIAIIIHAEESNVRIIIADNGETLSSPNSQDIFEPFVCSDESRNSKGGSGLGLAITKKIVLRHNGSITIEPYPNPYTKAFVIQMPLV